MRRFTQATVLPGILNNLGKDAVNSVQFLPGGSFRASFSTPEHKVRVENRGRFSIGTHECVIMATGPSQVDVYVHYYPFEAPDADIRCALSEFGPVKNLRYQSFPGYAHIKTGSRIIKMVVEREILSKLTIRGFPCRVWYKGQPIRCNICRDVGHLAASCPNKGLCRRCKEPGHTAGQCSKAWKIAQTSVPTAAGPSSSGVPPSAPAPFPQRGATCEQAPHASASDPFEETKKLLAEAMETGSGASDEDFSDDEVDDVDEGDSDGSNGISDYDTSEEDHLLVDDVDLSLMKTRSATKRAKRASSCEIKNNPASNVVSSAAAAPEAPIVPAAHAAFEGPVASVSQSSAPKRVSLEPNSLNKNVSVSSDNVSTVSNDNVAAEQRKLRSHSGNNQESESEMRTNSSIGNNGNCISGNSSIENCSGASTTEGISVPVVAKEAVANSPVSSSEPPTPSSSGVQPEMVSTPDLSGSRKISSRKNRAARFSPMEGLAAVRKHSRTPPFSGRSQKQ